MENESRDLPTTRNEQQKDSAEDSAKVDKNTLPRIPPPSTPPTASTAHKFSISQFLAPFKLSNPTPSVLSSLIDDSIVEDVRRCKRDFQQGTGVVRDISVRQAEWNAVLAPLKEECKVGEIFPQTISHRKARISYPMFIARKLPNANKEMAHYFPQRQLLHPGSKRSVAPLHASFWFDLEYLKRKYCDKQDVDEPLDLGTCFLSIEVNESEYIRSRFDDLMNNTILRRKGQGDWAVFNCLRKPKPLSAEISYILDQISAFARPENLVTTTMKLLRSGNRKDHLYGNEEDDKFFLNSCTALDAAASHESRLQLPLLPSGFREMNHQSDKEIFASRAIDFNSGLQIEDMKESWSAVKPRLRFDGPRMMMDNQRGVLRTRTLNHKPLSFAEEIGTHRTLRADQAHALSHLLDSHAVNRHRCTQELANCIQASNRYTEVDRNYEEADHLHNRFKLHPSSVQDMCEKIMPRCEETLGGNRWAQRVLRTDSSRSVRDDARNLNSQATGHSLQENVAGNQRLREELRDEIAGFFGASGSESDAPVATNSQRPRASSRNTVSRYASSRRRPSNERNPIVGRIIASQDIRPSALLSSSQHDCKSDAIDLTKK